MFVQAIPVHGLECILIWLAKQVSFGIGTLVAMAKHYETECLSFIVKYAKEKNEEHISVSTFFHEEYC